MRRDIQNFLARKYNKVAYITMHRIMSLDDLKQQNEKMFQTFKTQADELKKLKEEMKQTKRQLAGLLSGYKNKSAFIKFSPETLCILQDIHSCTVRHVDNQPVYLWPENDKICFATSDDLRLYDANPDKTFDTLEDYTIQTFLHAKSERYRYDPTVLKFHLLSGTLKQNHKYHIHVTYVNSEMFSEVLAWFKKKYDKLSEQEKEQLDMKQADDGHINLKIRRKFLAHMKQNEFACTICNEKICPEDLSTDVTCLSQCGHRFHSKCLEKYMNTKTCRSCKKFMQKNDAICMHFGCDNFDEQKKNERSKKLCPHPDCDTLIQNQELILLGEDSEAIPCEYSINHVNMPMHANYCVKL